MQVEALGQLLGAAAPADCVRPPAASAQIQGTFRLMPGLAGAVDALLLQLGLPPRALVAGHDGELVLRREVGRLAAH